MQTGPYLGGGGQLGGQDVYQKTGLALFNILTFDRVHVLG